jgi:predicted 3-demethylubiquinone-9 3-methyltransferase (glyoxalase superfamily)
MTTIKQKITPHLWYDKEAGEAAKLYTAIFKNSRIKNTTTLHNTPSGAVDVVTIELLGLEFTLISAGPLFKFNPSVSFLVACKTKDEVDHCGINSRKEARHSWSLANIRSARDMGGCRTGTAFHGR